MSELAYILLAGTVLFFVVVLWLFPGESPRRPETLYAQDPAARRRTSPARTHRPRTLPDVSPLVAENSTASDETAPVLAGDAGRTASDDEMESSFDDALEVLGDDEEASDFDDAPEPLEPDPVFIPPPVLRPVTTSATVTSTAQPDVGGAANHTPRRTFPEEIAIPVAMTVATPPAPPRPVIREVPFATNSVRAPVTWSPRPAASEPPRWATQSWRATSSVVARVSAIELPGPDDPRRRGLLIAAGAGLVVALAVAARR